jgi:hypothetical protein
MRMAAWERAAEDAMGMPAWVRDMSLKLAAQDAMNRAAWERDLSLKPAAEQARQRSNHMTNQERDFDRRERIRDDGAP